ncbi:ParA family protein [Halobacteria archaeon AArc-dxtr1]|nr:ParA family protein [Halobacteria archaeon AArc-dxtr1]
MSTVKPTPEVIAVSLQKGGTGKTFTAMNLAGGLAARGFDVLLVDLDPQGTLTANLGKREQYFDLDARSLDEVLLDPRQWDRIDELIEADHPEFDLIPANQSYNGNRTPLDTADGGAIRLGQVLENLDRAYHYVVCDCPPDFSPYTKNAITAGENVVVPMIPETEMPHSIDLLFDQYEVLELVHDLEIDYLAFLMTVNSTKLTTENRQIVDWFEDTFGEKGVVTDHRAAFSRAKKHQQSIYGYDDALANDQLDVYDEFVQLVVEQTEPPTFDAGIETPTAMTVETIRQQRANSE